MQTAPNLITARLLQVELDKREFERTKNKLIYKQLEINITKLFADGYLELPELMYSEQPKTVGLDSTYTPFAQENIREGTPTGKGTVLTLSNGRYDEFKNAKRIETIGSVRFNTEKNKIVGFGENKRSVEVVSRFLSVDPIAAQYPELTPYQFASNRPIQCIDLDGLEAYFNNSGEFIKWGADASETAPVIVVVDNKEIATSLNVKQLQNRVYWITGEGAGEKTVQYYVYTIKNAKSYGYHGKGFTEEQTYKGLWSDDTYKYTDFLEGLPEETKKDEEAKKRGNKNADGTPYKPKYAPYKEAYPLKSDFKKWNKKMKSNAKVVLDAEIDKNNDNDPTRGATNWGGGTGNYKFYVKKFGVDNVIQVIDENGKKHNFFSLTKEKLKPVKQPKKKD